MTADADREAALQRIEAEAAAAYDAAVSAEIARLRGLTNFDKRRATVLGLAEEATRPDISRQDVFSRPDTVSSRTFYDSRKDWGAGTSGEAKLFQEVLEKVIRLKVDYENGRDNRRMAAERLAWQDRMMGLAHRGAAQVEVMLNWPLYEEETDEDGQIVIFTPAKWSLRDAASLLTAVDKTARLALGEATERPDMTSAGEAFKQITYIVENRGAGLNEVKNDGDD